jgi:hypothetical protein
VPFGWTLTNGRLVPDPLQQEVLRTMSELYDEGMSLRQIAATLQTRYHIRMSHVGVRTILSGARRVDASPYSEMNRQPATATPTKKKGPRNWHTIPPGSPEETN